MPTILKTKNSVTTTVAPTTLQQGELAVNITDKKMWVGNAATTPVQIVGTGAGGGAAAGSNTQVQYNSSGALAGDADFTFNGTTVTMANDASISGLTVGKGGGAIASNMAIGFQAINASATGTANTAVGYQTGYSITSGTQNTFTGYVAGKANTTGSDNFASGYGALFSNTTGSNNIAIGSSALLNNTTASGNTAVGYQSGYTNSTGTLITAIGTNALYTSNGSNSTAVGYYAGRQTTTGSITALGAYALYLNTTGTANTALGGNDAVTAAALQSNTTGSYNVAVGTGALKDNTTADNNTAVGYQAGYSVTTGNRNTFLGVLSGFSQTGNFNTFLGARSGLSSTGSRNTFIGAVGEISGVANYGCGEVMTTGSNNTIIGGFNGNQNSLDIRTASGYIVLSDGLGNPRGFSNGSGNWIFGAATSPNSAANPRLTVVATGTDWVSQFQSGYTTGSGRTVIGFYDGSNDFTGQISIDAGANTTSYQTSSDYRLKEDIAPMTGALDKVAQLKPVTYKWKSNSSDAQGFIAHELQEIFPEAVGGEKDAVDEEGKPVYQGIDTSFLVATLTASIQELHEMVKAQALEIAQLKGN